VQGQQGVSTTELKLGRAVTNLRNGFKTALRLRSSLLSILVFSLFAQWEYGIESRVASEQTMIHELRCNPNVSRHLSGKFEQCS